MPLHNPGPGRGGFVGDGGMSSVATGFQFPRQDHFIAWRQSLDKLRKRLRGFLPHPSGFAWPSPLCLLWLPLFYTREPRSNELDARFAFAHLADLECRDALIRELALNALCVIRTNDHRETDAHVEDAEHLVLVDVAELLQPAEHRRHWPTAFVQEHTAVRR